jgi:hypothetical protein
MNGFAPKSNWTARFHLEASAVKLQEEGKTVMSLSSVSLISNALQLRSPKL